MFEEVLGEGRRIGGWLLVVAQPVSTLGSASKVWNLCSPECFLSLGWQSMVSIFIDLCRSPVLLNWVWVNP